MNRPQPVRSAPRRVRIHGSFTAGAESLLGFITSLSPTAANAIVRAEGAELSTGGTLRLRFELPGSNDLIEGPAEVTWAETDDDASNEGFTTRLGLELHLDRRRARKLEEFLAGFRYTVLVATSDEAFRRYAESTLTEYRVLSARSPQEAAEALRAQDVAVLLVGPNGDSELDLLKHVDREIPRSHAVRVVAPPEPSFERLARLVNEGRAFRVLSTDNRHLLADLVREAVDRHAIDAENERLASELERTRRWLERENRFMRQRLSGMEGFEHIVGNSPAIRQVLTQLERIVRTDAPVSIHGETGTGKELVARALHARGPRADRPYMVQNCAGMTETLLQSTLFGHRRGAFTGADRDHRGIFLEADGGTLFLDEVAELSPTVQAALLRAVQEGEIFPAGASRPVRVDVRLISATHRDLREEVKAGRFREDLFFRLVIVTVRLPPLRERTGDVALLARHFLDKHAEKYGKNVRAFSPEVMAALEAYAWPGNIRELEGEIQRMVILAEEGEKIGPELLAPHIQGSVPKAGAPVVHFEGSYDAAVESYERALIERALAESKGVLTQAAELLGMERSRLGKLKTRLGIGRT